MKKLIIFLLTSLLLLPTMGALFADDLSFNSFEEAEAAAQKRSAEYNKKMDEHLKKVNEDWEKQQKDLGESGASPDITDITSSSDGEKSSNNEASGKMEDAVNSSVNNLKDTMINSAAPNTTGFAGGGAGYQWKVKFKNGKYVLSDSYNEAAFGTGDKKDKDPEPKPPEPADEGSGADDDSDSAIASKPTSDPSEPASDVTPTTETTAGGDPATPATSDVASKGDAPSTGGDSKPTGTPPAKSEKPAEKATPGIDPAPTKLPEPAIRMVIQHPTDFSEEVFSSNADGKESLEYALNKFKIPEDTRVKISLELSNDVNPEDVSLIVTDEEGEGRPVSSTKMKNYRHMFRVPSNDNYSAKVVINDKSAPGSGKRQLMKVKIPVVKVEFDSRTIDGQRQKKGTGDPSNSAGTTSHSGSDGNYSHSSFGKPQQVDLSDMYNDAGNSSSGSSNNSSRGSEFGSSGDGQNSNGSSSGSQYASNSGSSGSSSSGNDISNRYGDDGNSEANLDNNSDQANETGDDFNENSTNSQGSQGSQGSQNNSEAGSALTNGGSSSNSGGSSNDGSSYGSSSSSNGNSASSNYGDNDGSESEEDSNDSSMESTRNRAGTPDGSGSGTGGDNENGRGLDGTKVASLGGNQGKTDKDEQDPFIMALSMQAISKKIYQSFDFIDEQSPVSASIPSGTEVTFSMSFDSSVDPESVRIVLNDGANAVKGDLKTWGDAFAYVFDKPAEAYFQINGKSEKGAFSYRLNIPIK